MGICDVYGESAAYEIAVRGWEYGDGDPGSGSEGLLQDIVERCRRGVAVSNASTNRKRAWDAGPGHGRREEGAPEEEEGS